MCSTVFLGLTYDTFQQLPVRTNAAALTDSVKRGKHLWEDKNCMGCHTLFGEGAYYAPELTRVYERRGAAFITAQLKDPDKMFPGQRRMTNYHFTDQEIGDLVAFFEWAQTVDLNGFPAKPTLGAPAQRALSASAQHKPQIFSQLCVTCHSLEGTGGTVGPALDGVGSRRDPEFLEKWLKDPVAMKADSRMPKMPLDDTQITELVTFLSSQKENAR